MPTHILLYFPLFHIQCCYKANITKQTHKKQTYKHSHCRLSQDLVEEVVVKDCSKNMWGTSASIIHQAIHFPMRPLIVVRALTKPAGSDEVGGYMLAQWAVPAQRIPVYENVLHFYQRKSVTYQIISSVRNWFL